MPPALQFRGVFAASAVTVVCCACLLTLLKSVLRSECSAPTSSHLRPVTIACMVAAVLSLAASIAHLFKSCAWSWTLAATICSKWQPVYFVFVSVQRLILTAIVTYAVNAGTGPCSDHGDAVHAISWMWLFATLTTALTAMSCDVNADASPALRRCTYGLLALILLLDTIGSVAWGNPLAADVSIFIANFSFLLDNQLTSSITSQLVIALYFLYVSCRSRHGRSWAYASLKFALDECSTSVPMQGLPMMAISRNGTGSTTSALTHNSESIETAPTQQLQRPSAAVSSAFSRLCQRWQWFQRQQMTRCRVFVIPCVSFQGAAGSDKADFVLARPAFNLRYLKPLQRLADANPKLYLGFVFLFLALPCITFNIIFGEGQVRGISTLVFIFFVFIATLAFISSNRNGLDQVAVKHVLCSFRFAIITTLLAMDVALSIRLVYTRDKHPTQVAAYAVTCTFFCLCILMDCSPHLPPAAQISVSVNTHKVSHHH
jgi:hypothetical protein